MIDFRPRDCEDYKRDYMSLYGYYERREADQQRAVVILTAGLVIATILAAFGTVYSLGYKAGSQAVLERLERIEGAR